MQCRLTFTASGDNFNARYCINKFVSSELISETSSEFPNFIDFYHPDEFSEYWDEEYEKAYLDFISKNIEILKQCGADDFSVMTEMYIEPNEQCNFQALDVSFNYYIYHYGIALPISVYTVEPKQRIDIDVETDVIS